MTDTNTESMATDTVADGDGSPPDDEYEAVVDIGERSVHSEGRVTIPAGMRDEFDIGHKDLLDISVETVEGLAFGATDVAVTQSGEVRIPHRKREIYGVEDGDTVAVVVAVRGVNAEEMPESAVTDPEEADDG